MKNSINKQEFLRGFEVRPNGSFNIFLGAGASVAAGVPTVTSLIGEFKRKLYCDKTGIKEEKLRDLESSVNKKTLQMYFDSTKLFPKYQDPGEYSFYFEKCYPKNIDRKFFIQNKLKNINPTIGHRCLAELFNAQKVSNIFTTNFDELVERGLSMQSSVQYKLITPDNSHQIEDVANEYPNVIKFHGDYRYDKLQNTTEETQNLDKRLRDYFVKSNEAKGLIFVGYNGHDQSIIESLRESLKLSNPFPYGLIWALREGAVPNDEIVDIIEEANKKNNLSGFIYINSFDEFMFELLEKSKISSPSLIREAANLFTKKKPFELPQSTDLNELVKLNGILLEKFPNTIYCFQAKLSGWSELRELTKNTNVIAALYKGKTYAFGSIVDIKKVFSSVIMSDIELVDIDNKYIYYEDSFILGLFYEIIERNLLNDYALSQVNPRRRRYFQEHAEIRTDRQKSYLKAFEAIELQLCPNNDRLYLVVLPTAEIIDTRSTESDISRYERQELANQILSNRYNKMVYEKMDYWLKILSNNTNKIQFTLDEFKILAQAKYSYGGYKTNTSLDFFQRLAVIQEPQLFFHSTDPNLKSTHPLKGLKNYGPYDYSLGQIENNISLALISPFNGFSRLIKHLSNLNKTVRNSSEAEYLLEYPGFHALFKKILEFPQTVEDKLSVTLKEDEVKQMSLIQFYETLKKKIDYFDTMRGDFDVVIIYIPSYWSHFRELKGSNGYFDLHDSVKIYAAKKNIKIQFIEDKSIEYFDQGKINWWLSLAIYVKANGIPWKQKNESENTAYIGLGYSSRNVDNSTEIIIGCSQLFDSSGLGLRFLMTPLERPVFYHKNPYMSQEDSRRVVTQLREMYFRVDPNAKLDKLVIHKTTPFSKEEILGINQAAEGLQDLELIQVQQFSGWRAIRSNKDNYGKWQPHLFPVKRGTILQLDKYSFLLWTHGSVTDKDIIQPGRNYFQGKRGIPSPLLIRRFQGLDPIENIAKSILSLTKMNWNGGQLYKTLPVTLDFSKNLSQIAKQAEALQNYPYDFRFFM